MKMIKLKDIFEIKKGKKVELVNESTPNKVRYIQIEDLRENSNIKYCSPNDNYVSANSESIIIAWDGANAGTVSYGLEGVIGSTLAVLETINKDIYIPYVGKYLQSKFNYFRDTCTGATIPHISRKALENLLIPIPSLEKQRYISKLLDKAKSLVDKRKAQIEALDQLTQSVFLEMFGDPKNNPKNFNKVSLGEIFEIKTGGTPSRKNKDYWNGDIPWVKTTEVNENVIMNTEEFISKEGLSNSNTVLLPVNSILIAMYGQGKTRGRTAKLGIEATTNQACAAILPNEEIEQDFIWNQLILQYDELRLLGRGGNQPNLNLNLVRHFEVIVPPVSMQREFVTIIKRVEKTKNNVKKSMKELENIFNSLMQRAFKGELFNGNHNR